MWQQKGEEEIGKLLPILQLVDTTSLTEESEEGKVFMLESLAHKGYKVRQFTTVKSDSCQFEHKLYRESV